MADDPASYPDRRLDDGSLLMPIGLWRLACEGVIVEVRVVAEPAAGLEVETTVVGREDVDVDNGAFVVGWAEVMV